PLWVRPGRYRSFQQRSAGSPHLRRELRVSAGLACLAWCAPDHCDLTQREGDHGPRFASSIHRHSWWEWSRTGRGIAMSSIILSAECNRDAIVELSDAELAGVVGGRANDCSEEKLRFNMGIFGALTVNIQDCPNGSFSIGVGFTTK